VNGPRDLRQRKADTLSKLATENDIWVATASGSGAPCLVPLSFAWIDERIVLATPRGNRTTRNISETGVARLALGPTRDVVSFAGSATVVDMDALGEADAIRYAEKTGWDPRSNESLVWIEFRPSSIQAWREVNEIEGRTVMDDGRWLV
jgi:hypothetical protein